MTTSPKGVGREAPCRELLARGGGGDVRKTSIYCEFLFSDAAGGPGPGPGHGSCVSPGLICAFLVFLFSLYVRWHPF